MAPTTKRIPRTQRQYELEADRIAEKMFLDSGGNITNELAFNYYYEQDYAHDGSEEEKEFKQEILRHYTKKHPFQKQEATQPKRRLRTPSPKIRRSQQRITSITARNVLQPKPKPLPPTESFFPKKKGKPTKIPNEAYTYLGYTKQRQVYAAKISITFHGKPATRFINRKGQFVRITKRS